MEKLDKAALSNYVMTVLTNLRKYVDYWYYTEPEFRATKGIVNFENNM